MLIEVSSFGFCMLRQPSVAMVNIWTIIIKLWSLILNYLYMKCPHIYSLYWATTLFKFPPFNTQWFEQKVFFGNQWRWESISEQIKKFLSTFFDKGLFIGMNWFVKLCYTVKEIKRYCPHSLKFKKLYL